MMTDRRRAAVWLLVLAAVVVAGDHLTAWMLNRLVVRSQFRYSRVYRGGDRAEILVLGDSRGAISFPAPLVEEMARGRVLNLSYSGMSPLISEAVLLDYLDHNPPPRMVVHEVSSVISEGALVTEMRTFAGLSPRLAALYQQAHPVAAVAGRLFRLYPLNSEMFLDVLHHMRRSDQDVIRQPYRPAGLARMSRGHWRLDPRAENIASVARIVHLLRVRGIEVRLVITPYAPENQPVNLREFIDLLTKRTEAPVWNYAAALDDPDVFADGVHLHVRGVVELLKILRRDDFFGMAQPPPRF
jgi:hypothetical protein